LKQVLKYTLLSDTILITVIFTFSRYIYNILTGNYDEIGIYSFRFWLVISFFTILNVMINPFIISLNQDKYMAKFYMIVGLSFLIVSTILTNYLKIDGMLISMLLIEIVILIFSLTTIKKGFKYNEIK
jgi:O-antigen/teichoic acid export membrane protein